MARKVDYDVVLNRLTGSGLICNYHNSGSFGFARDVATKFVGWVGPDDPTIRETMLPHVQRVAEPYAINLSRLMLQAQTELLHDVAWAMPISHWAYELEFGSDTWMPGLLERTGIDPADLRVRNNGSAIEFAIGEPAFETFLLGLLHGLSDSSDFMIAFPDRPALCMVHHHQQLWWMTKEEQLADQLRALVE